MTNGWVDMKNTDMMLIMGGNPAENHPCGFKWPIEAKRTRNAKIISVDPRFTRTSAVADLFCQIRAGTDIAFLGGVIRYATTASRKITWSTTRTRRSSSKTISSCLPTRMVCFPVSTPRRRATTSPRGIMRGQEAVEETPRILRAEALHPLRGCRKKSNSIYRYRTPIVYSNW